jgi:hypothetical protein
VEQADQVTSEPGQQETGSEQVAAAAQSQEPQQTGVQQEQEEPQQAPVLPPALVPLPEEGPPQPENSREVCEEQASGAQQVAEHTSRIEAVASEHSQPLLPDISEQGAPEASIISLGESSLHAAPPSVPDMPTRDRSPSPTSMAPPVTPDIKETQAPSQPAEAASQVEVPHAIAHVNLPPASSHASPSINQTSSSQPSSPSPGQSIQKPAPGPQQPSTVSSPASNLLPTQEGTVQLSVPADQAVAALLAVVGQEPASAARALAGLIRLVPGPAAVEALASLLPPTSCLEPLIRSLPTSTAVTTLAQVAGSSSATRAEIPADHGAAGSSKAVVEFSQAQGFVRVVPL